MTLKEYYIKGKNFLSQYYEVKEAEALCLRLLEDKYNFTRKDLIVNSDIKINLGKSYFNALDKLSKRIPIQHITGFQEFMGYRFKTTKSTLIPRPETEELVSIVLEKHKTRENLSILDIGTGTGAIAISLKLLLASSCHVSAIDISKRALKVAEYNALQNNAEIEFSHLDFLKNKPTGEWDIIISNPPYIPEKDKSNIGKNVLNHDPALALFVSNNKPLIFYTEISQYAYNSLKNNGILYFEINDNYGKETVEEVRKAGFTDISLEKDMFGKDRFIWCRK